MAIIGEHPAQNVPVIILGGMGEKCGAGAIVIGSTMNAWKSQVNNATFLHSKSLRGRRNPLW